MADTNAPAPCPACSPDQATYATPSEEMRAILAHHPGLYVELAGPATHEDVDVLKRRVREREQRLREREQRLREREQQQP